jgi:hypothetical protein
LATGVYAGSSDGAHRVYEVKGKWVSEDTANPGKSSYAADVDVYDVMDKDTRCLVFVPTKGIAEGAVEVMRVLVVDEGGGVTVHEDFAGLETPNTAWSESALFTLITPGHNPDSGQIDVATSIAGWPALIQATLQTSKDEDGRSVVELTHADEQAVSTNSGDWTVSNLRQRFVFDDDATLPAEAEVSYTISGGEFDAPTTFTATAQRTERTPLDRKAQVTLKRELRTLGKVAEKAAAPAPKEGEESSPVKSAKRWASGVKSAARTYEKLKSGGSEFQLARAMISMEQYLQMQAFQAEDAVAEAEFEATLKGKPAPDFDLATLGGGRVTLSEHSKGKLTLLAYWAVG